MSKKKKILLILVLILIGIISISTLYYFKKPEEVKRKHNEIAIMIKNNGDTEYKKSNSNDIPTGTYKLDYNKSYCKNNGVIGDYDRTLGKVSFSFVGTDSCFLYFYYYLAEPEKQIFIEKGTVYTNVGEIIVIDNPEEMSKYCYCKNSDIDSDIIDGYSILGIVEIIFNNIMAADAEFFVPGLNPKYTFIVRQKINDMWMDIDTEILGDNYLKIPNLSNEGEIAIYIKTS